EYQLRVVERDVIRLQPAGGDVVLAPGELDVLILALKTPALGELRRDAHDGEWLLPGVAGKGGLIPDALELALQVQPGQLIAACPGPTALEQVRGQETDRSFPRPAGEGGGGRLLHRCRNRRGRSHGHYRYGGTTHQNRSPEFT